MPFIPTKMPVSKDPKPKEWMPANLAGGVVYTDLPFEILDNQSPDMLNMWYKDKILCKRYGQEYAFTTLGSFSILAVYEKKFNGYTIFAASTKLYKADLSTGSTTVIYSSLTASKGSFFTFKNKSTGVSILYYINGHEFIMYDGTTASKVQDSAYIPTVLKGRAPTGGGTVNEQYNAIGAGFTTSFSPTGSATVYQLPQTNLDSTTVTCTLSGVAKVEGTDFTVNRTTGAVTFNTAPVTGTDTLKITAYKADATQLGYILACKYSITFGGNNDTRVFMAGDTTTYYYSGLQDPTYWPENQYNNAGVDNTSITGFGVQYNTLIIFKERSLGTVNYSVNLDGSNPSFPYARMNSAVGCDMPYTIQLIDNRLVWCTTYSGVYTLTNESQIKDEKNVKPLSYNINGSLQRPGILSEQNLKDAVSFDMWGMYWLCIGSKVWVWDYSFSPYVDTGDLFADQRRLSWFPLTNINANCFVEVNGEVYYGDRTNGYFVHLKNNYMDFGNAIDAYIKIKVLDFGIFQWLKYILEVRYETRSDTYTDVDITYYYSNGTRKDPQNDIVGSFNWALFNWSAFTWGVISIAKAFRKSPKIKDTEFFSIKFENNIAGHNLSIINLAILWIPTRRTK